jgi:uncharacterized protein YceH (UPF0502 family)
MTLNALRTACNQKSSRDPVTDYDDDTVSLALSGLKRKCLVTFIPYGSGGQHKYRHFLEDIRFNLHKPDLAVLSVLLLRGAQTLNEVKLRASSQHPIDTLESAEAVLNGLARREEPLAELLAKRPGWKEPRWRDTVRAHADAAGSDGDYGTAPGTGSPEDAGSAAPPAGKPASYVPSGSQAQAGRSKWDEFEDMKRDVAELKAGFTALKAENAGLKALLEKMQSELGG